MIFVVATVLLTVQSEKVTFLGRVGFVGVSMNSPSFSRVEFSVPSISRTFSCKASNSYRSPVILTYENENWERILRAISGLAILLLFAVSVGGVTRAVNAPVGIVFVSVSPTSVPVGQPFTVTFRIATGAITFTGTEEAHVSITTYDWNQGQLNLAFPHIWDSAFVKNVQPDVTYPVSAPGLSTPGNNYIAVVGVDRSGGALGVAVGFAYFQVVQVAGTTTAPPQHVVVTSATTVATTTTAAVKTAVTHVIITSDNPIRFQPRVIPG